MIAAGELQSFVPFGREHCKNHPNAVNLQLRQLQPASELWSSDGAAGLVGSLQEVTLQERDKVVFPHMTVCSVEHKKRYLAACLHCCFSLK